jgi:hypothetical protein
LQGDVATNTTDIGTNTTNIETNTSDIEDINDILDHYFVATTYFDNEFSDEKTRLTNKYVNFKTGEESFSYSDINAVNDEY